MRASWNNNSEILQCSIGKYIKDTLALLEGNFLLLSQASQKVQDCQMKLAKFHFVLQKTFSLLDKYPVNLSKKK